MRQLAAYEEKKAELESLDATVYAVSVDSLEQAKEVVARGLTFPVAYGVTRDECELLGAWWQEERGYVQPAEFLLGRGGVVLGSMYASGPVGRMAVDEALRLITNREGRRREQEQAGQQVFWAPAPRGHKQTGRVAMTIPIVYTLRTCRACNKLKEDWAEQGIEFEERQVDANQTWLDEAVNLGDQVPIIVYGDGRVEVGYADTIG